MEKFFFLNMDVENSRRFEISKFLNFSDNYDPLTSFLLSELNGLPPSGYFKVSGQDGRPDLISNEIYGDVHYWWVIMSYNDIQNVEDIVTGMEIKYPSISSLEDLYFSLKIQEQANNTK